MNMLLKQRSDVLGAGSRASRSACPRVSQAVQACKPSRERAVAVVCEASEASEAKASTGHVKHAKAVPASAMSRRQLISTSMATLAFFGCPCCNNLGQQAKASEEWGYSTNVIVTGPQYWPATCAVGKQQSPVNLPVNDRVHKNSPRFGELAFKYSEVEKTFVSNPGHGSMQLNFSPGKVCQINDDEYELLQYHFHTPSEHALDGKRYAMEAHLVHQNKKTGNLAVVGIMLEPSGEENPCVEVGLENAPQPGFQIPVKDQVDPMLLLPPPNGAGHRTYVHYPGSLTTPPCSENVDWFVMTTPIKISDQQVLRFMRFVGGNTTYGQNSRPLQPPLGRFIDYEL